MKTPALKASNKKPVRVGLLGLGAVGSEVYADLQRKGIKVSGIAVRHPEKSRNLSDIQNLFKSAKEVVDDCNLLIEVMGGISPAHFLIERALTRGCPVITANKQLVARFGSELSALAVANDTTLSYSAAVGGEVPMVELVESLQAKGISRLSGILNGTTTYLLSKMEEGISYQASLQEAKNFGYAEANAEEDVAGLDAAAKLVILSSLAFQKRFELSKVIRREMGNLDISDLKVLSEEGYFLRQVARAEKRKGGFLLTVLPELVDERNSLAGVTGTGNRLIVETKDLRLEKVSGRGASGSAAASSIAADLARVLTEKSGSPSYPKMAPRTLSERSFRCAIYFRAATTSPFTAKDVWKSLEKSQIEVKLASMLEGHEGSQELAVLTRVAPLQKLEAFVESLASSPNFFIKSRFYLVEES